MSGTAPFDPSLLDEGRASALARNWWVLVLRGVLGILFGLAAFFLPGVTIASLVLLFGAYAAVDGVFAIIAGVRAAARQERWGWLIFEGVVNLGAAAAAFFYPILTVWAFVIFSAAWAVVSGIALLIATFRLPVAHGRWLMGLGAVVSILWGVLLFVAPLPGLLVMTWWLGGYALVFGVMLILLGIRLRSRRAA